MFKNQKWAPMELQRLRRLVEKYGADEVIRVTREFSVTTGRRRKASVNTRKKAKRKSAPHTNILPKLDDENDKTLDPPRDIDPPKISRSHSYTARSPRKAQSKHKFPRRVSTPVRAMSSKRSGLSRSQFLLGDFIRVDGSTRRWVNGLYGEINGPFNVRKDRWPVALTDINGKERKITVKTENIELIEENGRGDFEVGDSVQIFGLKDTEFNGIMGTITSEFKRGKWPVMINHSIFKHGVVEDNSQEIVQVQQHNLRKVLGTDWHPIANSFCSHAGLQSACMLESNRCLALEMTDNSVHCWDAVSGDYNRIINFSSDLNPRSIKVSPDGKLLIAMGDHIQVWRLESNELLSVTKRVKGQMGLFQSFDISWDCTTLIVGYGGSSQDFEVKLFDMGTAEEIQCFEGLRMPVKCMKMTKNNDYMITAHQDVIDHGVKPTLCQIRKFDCMTGEVLYNIAHEAEIHFICITKDERYVLVGDATATIKVFNFDTMERVQEIKTKNQQVTCGVISRGDEYLITGGKGSSRRDTYYINVWNVDTGDSEFALMFRNKQNHDWIETVGLSDDQRYIYYLRGSHCKVGMINCEQFLVHKRGLIYNPGKKYFQERLFE